MSVVIKGSIRSRAGVTEVTIARSRPAVRCRSALSLSSRSSKISGLNQCKRDKCPTH
jgi:hypothetical protein